MISRGQMINCGTLWVIKSALPLFCELAYDNGKWPKNVRNFHTDATTLAAMSDGEELPHHALLDARIIAGMFSRAMPG